MANSDTRFTALGMSGSGKTCYVMGMYRTMAVGKGGWTVTTQSGKAVQLDRMIDDLNNRNAGRKRFPDATSPTEINDYGFSLFFNNEKIMSFDWADYAGGILKVRDGAKSAFSDLNQSISDSTVLYIFIDGELFCGSDIEDKIEDVQQECSRTINPYLTDYMNKHKDDGVPPVVFVITKSDLCAKYTNNEETIEILRQAFSNMIAKGQLAYVVTVSLGERIADDGYTGRVKPINIQIPFFIGIYHEFFNYCCALKSQIDNANQASNRAINNNLDKISQNQSTISSGNSAISSSENSISSAKSNISYENSRFFLFRNRGSIRASERRIEEQRQEIINQQKKIAEASSGIDNARQKISQLQAEIKANEELLSKYRKLLQAVVLELTKQSRDFIVLQDGKEVEFDATGTLI